METKRKWQYAMCLFLAIMAWPPATTLKAAGQQYTTQSGTFELKYITVILDMPNTTRLFWTPVSSNKIKNYTIYRIVNPLVPPSIIAVVDSSKLSYTDVHSLANFKPNSYQVCAYKDTISHDLLGATIYHTTNYFKATFDTCNSYILLKWTGYKGWGKQLTAYAVYGKYGYGNNSFALLDSVSGQTLQDTLFNVLPNENYCFYVRAYNTKGYISYSNRQCVETHMLTPPSFISVNTVTVTGNKTVGLSFSLDTASQIHYYILLRGAVHGVFHDTIGQWPDYPGDELNFTDNLADSISAPLYYRLAAINPCGRTLLTSKPATVLFLQGFYKNFTCFLSWNRCLSYDTIERYTIYRGAGNNAPEKIIGLTGTDTAWADPVRDLQYTPGNTGIYCYTVEAAGRNITPSGKEVLSRSTQLCLEGDISVYIPNAFTPNGDGKNDIFTPVFSFYPDEYHLIIRNRRGTILFETRDYLKAWNGKDKNNHPAAQGVYIYFVYARTPAGKEIKKTGYVTVIYP